MKYILAYSAFILGMQEGFTQRTIVVIAFALWSIPLSWMRTRFRKEVYETTDWKIVLQPKFFREVQVLCGGIDFKNKKLLFQYRMYLLGFLMIYFVYRFVV